MAKLFRKIRQGLLDKNKFTKYLFYAIGEIILVVIGILIALSINNKNTIALNRKAEQVFYKNLRNQLIGDTSNIEGQKRFNKFYADQFEYALSLIESNNKLKKDTLAKIAVNLPNYSDFDRKGNVYETIVNSGDIKLITNYEIIERIRRLEEIYIYVNKMETIHLDAVMSLIPSLMDNLDFYSSKIENEDYFYSYKFKNALVISLRLMNEKQGVYDWALSEIDETIQLLDTEIKN